MLTPLQCFSYFWAYELPHRRKFIFEGGMKQSDGLHLWHVLFVVIVVVVIVVFDSNISIVAVVACPAEAVSTQTNL